jgi:pyruvate formate lyase activating enzyme
VGPKQARYLLGDGWASAAAPDPLPDLIKAAPRARYWISTVANTASSCLACHRRDETEEVSEDDHGQVLIKCLLCAQGCLIAAGERGRCRTRIHVDGELRTLVYGRPITVHIDPIEKKPFYHFLPGSLAYSLATSGCPLHCKFCQNWEISQARPEDYSSPLVTPVAIMDVATAKASPVIAFTYNEPTVFTEYLTDIAREARKRGVRSVLVSCGFMTEAPLAEMCDVLDAIKIDLKGFSSDFYQKVCGAELAPVLRSIKQTSRSGKHLEIVNLVVPTLNDSDRMLDELASWIVNEIGPDVPVHFTRFHPDYQLRNLPPTPIATLERARAIATDKGIHYAFVGNVPGHPGNNTYCPACGRPVIIRRAFFIDEMHVKDGCCEYCQEKIAGVWN